MSNEKKELIDTIVARIAIIKEYQKVIGLIVPNFPNNFSTAFDHDAQKWLSCKGISKEGYDQIQHNYDNYVRLKSLLQSFEAMHHSANWGYYYSLNQTIKTYESNDYIVNIHQYLKYKSCKFTFKIIH
jgi:predicted deacetylase